MNGISLARMMMPRGWFKEGAIVCVCSDTSDYCVDYVRAWCKGSGYTGDDVRIVKRNGQTLAEAKRDLGPKFDGDVIE